MLLTMRLVWEIVEGFPQFLDDRAWSEKLAKWIFACENPEGFAFWPGGLSRLSSSFYALTILHAHGLGPHHGQLHARWIESLQQPDGSFRGPWSGHPPGADTYFAVRALDLLGHRLSDIARTACARWAHDLLGQALQRQNADSVFYCVEILASLGHEGSWKDRALRWACKRIHVVALEHPGRSVESLHYLLQILHCCGGAVADLGTLAGSLANRISLMLDAELPRLESSKAH